MIAASTESGTNTEISGISSSRLGEGLTTKRHPRQSVDSNQQDEHQPAAPAIDVEHVDVAVVRLFLDAQVAELERPDAPADCCSASSNA